MFVFCSFVSLFSTPLTHLAHADHPHRGAGRPGKGVVCARKGVPGPRVPPLVAKRTTLRSTALLAVPPLSFSTQAAARPSTTRRTVKVAAVAGVDGAPIAPSRRAAVLGAAATVGAAALLPSRPALAKGEFFFFFFFGQLVRAQQGKLGRACDPMC